MTATGAILAGGASSRMGRPKQDVVLGDGRSMIEHVHDALSAVTHRVVIVGDCDALESLARVCDLRPGCGPLGGIEALLATGFAAEYLIVPCDVPRITPELLERLLIKTDKPATAFEGHPLPARLSVEALPTVRSMLDADERAVWRLLDRIEVKRIELLDEHAALLRNVNSPEDAAHLGRGAT